MHVSIHKGLAAPAVLMICILTATAGVTFLNTQNLFSSFHDAVGLDRSAIEQRMGPPRYTARSWEQGIRQSVRTGGLKMNHSQVTFTDLKPGRKIGSTPNDRILIWTDDEHFLEYADNVTHGHLSQLDMPTSIAINFPKSVWVAQLDHTNTVIAIHDLRPSFVVVHQD